MVNGHRGGTDLNSRSGTKGQIILVEDDAIVRELHAAVLLGAGFDVEATDSLAGLRERIGTVRCDVILLDLKLPDGNALDVIPLIRGTTSAGIIVATANQTQESRLAGLEAGADEFLEKPVHPRELVARIRNMVERLRVAPENESSPGVYRFEGWTADLVARKVTFGNGTEVRLTENEFRLLETLIRNAGKPVHRDRLISAIADSDAVTARAVDKAIYRARLKLSNGGRDTPPLIETVHGYGYCLTATPL